MKIKGFFYSYVFALFSVLGFLQESVHGRPLLMSQSRPRPDDAAPFARWLVSQSYWGVLNTISSDWGGAPFGNVVSFSDGLPDEGKGIPYFYLTTLDPTARNALKDQRSSFTISEYNLGTCGNEDPENPACAKNYASSGSLLCCCHEVFKRKSDGSTIYAPHKHVLLKLLEGNSEEAEFARAALFTKHPEMKSWPKSHNFQVFKLDIENIFMINWYGGPKPLTVEQYLNTERSKPTFITYSTA